MFKDNTTIKAILGVMRESITEAIDDEMNVLVIEMEVLKAELRVNLGGSGAYGHIP